MNFILNILGTASALPKIDRNPSAQVLNVREHFFLIDCGEGAQMQMRRMRISFLKIEAVCLSHIHGDHLFGLFGLLSTMGMLGRTEGLDIYAPKSFAPILKFYLSYFGDGMKFEIRHHALAMKAPELIADVGKVELYAFPLNHRIDSFGFIIREKEPMLNVRKEAVSSLSLSLSEIGALKRGEDVVRPAGEDAEPSAANGFVRFSGTDTPMVIRNEDVTYRPYSPRSYAYCSDTAPFPELENWVRGVDLLYHEATFPSSMNEMAVKTFHSTASDAAKCALAAGVKHLLIGHYSSRLKTLDSLLDEARCIFPNTDLTNDGDVIELPFVSAKES